MLDQFDPADRTPVQIISAKAQLSPVATGVDSVPLHADPRELEDALAISEAIEI